MALLLLLAVLTALILFLLAGVSVRFAITFSNMCVESAITIPLWGFIKIHSHLRISLTPLRFYLNEKLLNRVKKTGRKISPSGKWIWFLKNGGVHLQSLHIDGVMGVENDAAATLLATGTVEAIVSALICSVLHTRQTGVQFRPQVNVGIFSLAIYGIVQIKPTQIIAAALWRLIHKKRGNSHVSSR